MPPLISRIWRSAGEASRSSTIRAMRPLGAHDAAVAVGPLHDGRHDGGRGVGRAMGVDEARERAGPQERHVARQQDDRAGPPRQDGFRLLKRVRGAELRFLERELK